MRKRKDCMEGPHCHEGKKEGAFTEQFCCHITNELWSLASTRDERHETRADTRHETRDERSGCCGAAGTVMWARRLKIAYFFIFWLNRGSRV
jgi:hypothetical protein